MTAKLRVYLPEVLPEDMRLTDRFEKKNACLNEPGRVTIQFILTAESTRTRTGMTPDRPRPSAVKLRRRHKLTVSVNLYARVGAGVSGHRLRTALNMAECSCNIVSRSSVHPKCLQTTSVAYKPRPEEESKVAAVLSRGIASIAS